MALETLNQTTTEPENKSESESNLGYTKAAPIKVGKNITLPAVGGAVPVSESVLENMQKLIAEKQAQKESFMENLKDATAWWSGGLQGPSEALSRRATARDAQAAELFQMQNALAQYKAAQAAQKSFEDRRNKELGLGGEGTPTTAGGTGGGAPSLYDMPSPIRNALANAKTEEEYKKIYNAWAQEVGKAQLSSERNKLYDVVINGQTKQKPLWWIEQNPQLFTEEGATTTAPIAVPAPAATTPSAPSAQPSNVPVSVRNNNPGNLVDPKTGKFRVFDTPEEGEAALDADVEAKLSGNSPAYKQRFGNLPITSERLAEVWSPSDAIGNSRESTRNYGIEIAKELGIKPGDTIPNTPEAIEAVKRAITRVEAGAYQKPPTTATATTPVSTTVPVSTKPTLKATSKEEAVAEGEMLKSEAAASGKSAGELGEQVLRNRENYGTNVVRAEKIYKLADENPNMVGVFTKPGVIAMTGTGLKEGIKVGPHGQLALPAIEEMTAQMTKGATGPSLQARRDLAQTLHEVELDLSKLLKGQGTVSDAERRILSGIAGSVSDPADLLKKKALVLKLHAEYDKELGDAYRKSGLKYSQFRKTDEYQRVIDAHTARLQQNFKKEYASGKDIPVDETKLTTPSRATARKSDRKALVDRWAK